MHDDNFHTADPVGARDPHAPGERTDAIPWEPQEVSGIVDDDDDGAALVPFEMVAQLATEEQIQAAVHRLCVRVEAGKRLKAAMLSMTNKHDWCAFYSEGDPDGRPYLETHGCQKVMHAFGIEVEHDGGALVQHSDGSYEFVYTGQVRARAFSDIWYPVVGSRWSNDGFFSRGGQQRVDPGDVRKSGHTNFMNRAIKTALGIGSLTWEEIEQVPGMENLRRVVKRVGFKDTSSGPSGSPPTQPGEKHEIATGAHLQVILPYELASARAQLKKAIRPGDRTFTGKEGDPPNTWLIRHDKHNTGSILDLAAENPSIKVVPINVPAGELP